MACRRLGILPVAQLRGQTFFVPGRVFGSRFYSTCHPRRRPYFAATLLASVLGITIISDDSSVRHSYLAAQRCWTIGEAAVLSMIDYKRVFSQSYPTLEEQQQAYSACHTRSAQRVLRSLLKNGGIYIKLGQHLSSLAIVPYEWSSTMRPLQDRCVPSPYQEVEELVQKDIRADICDIFDEFDPEPIGVASLAQVHVGRLKSTGEDVAIKVQHPRLSEFTQVDLTTVEILVGWIKFWFPEFELSWLAEEARQNLPKEMNFLVEAENAARVCDDFEEIQTSLYIPKVVFATNRILVMEYIKGGRVDDKLYLSEHNIDRNKVALELQRIFSRMVHVNGWFHADPHPGNLLIRPASTYSRSPYNFEIVLLDHGLYFDLEDELRINYSKMWLSLISGQSAAAQADRKKYAKLVGNIDEELYPIFETAITGRIDFVGSGDSAMGGQHSNIIDLLPQSEIEKDAIIDAILRQGGVIESVFDLLRKVPRRILMVLKLNDLTRNLDQSLDTTHSEARIIIIVARFCSLAVWRHEKHRIWGKIVCGNLASIRSWMELCGAYWQYQKVWNGFRLVEFWMDASANIVRMNIWLRTFATSGLRPARLAAAGITGHNQETTALWNANPERRS